MIDELLRSYPARSALNQRTRFAADSLQVQRAAKVTTTHGCSVRRICG